MKTGKPQTLKSMNKNAILKLLIEQGAMSRAEIERKLNVSFPTVSNNVKYLLEQDLVNEVGKDDNYLGRKATLVEFNARTGYIIGIDVGRTQIRGMSSNLLGETIDTVKIDFEDMEKENSYLLEIIIQVIDSLINSCSIKNLMFVCVGIPGIRDEITDKYVLAPFFKSLQNINIKETIKKRYHTNVEIDNTANLGAIGEYWQGEGQGYNNLIYIRYGIGIGAGIIINGDLYTGINNVAGEVGYMTLDKFHLHNSFREEGALEELISTVTLKEKMKRLTGGKEVNSVNDIFKRATSGEVLAQEIIGDTTIYMAMTLINLISVLNPEVVIISGEIGIKLYKEYKYRIIEILNNHVPFVPEIKYSKISDDASVLGAIKMGLDYSHQIIYTNPQKKKAK